MLIAFYAPMKPLDDPVPSGDRQMGRLIVRALEEAGHRVTIAATGRSWSRHGGGEQHALRAICEAEADALIARGRDAELRPDLWITYHLYHKAPDWIGPKVCDALGLPYIVIEASRAKKRATGAWAEGFAAADRALRRADAAVALHAEDAEGLAEIVSQERLFRVAPFIDAARFQSERRAPSPRSTAIRLLTVAMMRRGDKEHSYTVLAEALARLGDRAWSLTIAGDGAAREDILALFPPERTRWLGLVAPEQVAAVYGEADLFVWPAVNEAFGLVFLEAQAAGLPVVAGRTGGVPDVVGDGVTGILAREGDAADFATALSRFLDRPEDLAAFGARAQAAVEKRHGLAIGSKALQNVLDAVMAARALPPALSGLT